MPLQTLHIDMSRMRKCVGKKKHYYQFMHSLEINSLHLSSFSISLRDPSILCKTLPDCQFQSRRTRESLHSRKFNFLFMSYIFLSHEIECLVDQSFGAKHYHSYSPPFICSISGLDTSFRQKTWIPPSYPAGFSPPAMNPSD